MNAKWGNQSRVFGLIRNQVIQKYWRCNHLYQTSFFKSHFRHLVSEHLIGLRSLFWTKRYPLPNSPVRIKALAPGPGVNLRFPGSFKYYSCFISFNSHKFVQTLALLNRSRWVLDVFILKQVITTSHISWIQVRISWWTRYFLIEDCIEYDQPQEFRHFSTISSSNTLIIYDMNERVIVFVFMTIKQHKLIWKISVIGPLLLKWLFIEGLSLF